MLKTDYIKAFTEAIEKADLENKNVVRNLDNALVMASAKYEGDSCTNIQIVTATCQDDVNPWWQFASADYRIKPEPQYKPFDAESFKPYRDCWFWYENFNSLVKVIAFDKNGVVMYLTHESRIFKWDWEAFMKNFTLDGKPAGVEV